MPSKSVEELASREAMEDALWANLQLLGFGDSQNRGTKAHASSGNQAHLVTGTKAFRTCNVKALEAILHFLLSTFQPDESKKVRLYPSLSPLRQ